MNLFDALNSEALRLYLFLFFFFLFAVAEKIFPYRKKLFSQSQRWVTSFCLVLVSVFLLKFIPGLSSMSVALLAENNSWGLLSLLALPVWLKIVVSIVVLDFLIYLQHRLFHKVGLFWRFHRVHHVDRDFDVATGIRFHPLEIILSMLYKCICVLALGCPLIAVLAFDILLNVSALFTHSNFQLPEKLDRVLRWVFVTPNMHRIHHSHLEEETNSNYGFFISVWDRLGASYKNDAKEGNAEFTIGLDEYQNEQPSRLWWSLRLPFSSSS
ncbi:MAG: sterol desaturase family protein [Agarilytica sp.]